MCSACEAQPQASLFVLYGRYAKLERERGGLVRICSACKGGGGIRLEGGGIVCTSLDCGVYYARCKVQNELDNAKKLVESVSRKTFPE